MINIDNTYKQIQNESSSKGNQIKFYKDGIWFKLDNDRCSEGLAEEIASLFADCIVNFPHVLYNTCEFSYKDDYYLGCYCENMLSATTEFISLRRLFKLFNYPLNLFIREDNIGTNILNVVKVIEESIGINIFTYLNRVLYFDALILNEDRHYMNLGVALDNKLGYCIAPNFDNGSSLFCTNWTYRKTKSLEENLKVASSVARPFSKFFDKQILALQQLGAQPLQISFNKVSNLVDNYKSTIYSQGQQQLALNVLKARLNYYKDKGVFVYV